MIRWRYFFRRGQNWFAISLILLFVVVAILAPWLAPPDDPENDTPFQAVDQTFSRIPLPPDERSILGTVPQIQNLPLFGIAPGQDASYQWDVYYTLVWGTRSALRFGLEVTVITAVFGVLIGVVSAYWGGLPNRLLMGITDAFLAFPVIAALWVIQRTLFSQLHNFFPDPETWRWWEQLLHTLKINPIMLALILFSWMPYARMMNASITQLRQADFIEAAIAMGASGPRLIGKHLLPNAISPTMVLIARDIGGMVVLAAAFTFIGFGSDIAWGIILVSSRDYVIGLGGNPFVYWWSFVPFALALTLFALGWNLLGDGLNSAMNPHHSRFK
jgi:peptide/nickel transport system permease protein